MSPPTKLQNRVSTFSALLLFFRSLSVIPVSAVIKGGRGLPILIVSENVATVFESHTRIPETSIISSYRGLNPVVSISIHTKLLGKLVRHLPLNALSHVIII